MSTLRVNNITDYSGGDTNLNVPNTAKAWVNFNGTGTVAIRADFNVESITDEGTGDYRILFTNNLVDNDYAVVISSTVRNNATEVLQNGIRSSAADWVSGENAMSNSSVRILNRASSGAGDIDIDVVCVAIFR
jgi:hypothetical protein